MKIMDNLKMVWYVITYPLFPIYCMGVIWAFGLISVGILALLGIPVK